jgi:hypothetical protein
MKNIQNKVFFKITRDMMSLNIAGNTLEDLDFKPQHVLVPKHKKVDFANPHFGGTAFPPNPLGFDLEWKWIKN